MQEIFPGDSDCENALREALLRANSIRRSTPGTDDLLIGSLRQFDNPATRYLAGAGLTASEVETFSAALSNGLSTGVHAGVVLPKVVVTVSPTADASGAISPPASGPTPALARVLNSARALSPEASTVRLGHLLAAILGDRSTAQGMLVAMGYSRATLAQMQEECRRIADEQSAR